MLTIATKLGLLALGLVFMLSACMDEQESALASAYSYDAGGGLAQSNIEPIDSLKICGGFTGKTCSENEFCNFHESTRCGAGTQSGTCAEVPDSCTRESNPVCGCDGHTYSNRCVAASNAVSVRSLGACN